MIIIVLYSNQGRREGGGQRGAKSLGPGLVWGPEISIKHLVIVLLPSGLGARNALSLACPGARPRFSPALILTNPRIFIQNITGGDTNIASEASAFISENYL